MFESIEPILQHSPYGGALALEQVAGSTSGKLNPENDVDVSMGADRSMYVYVPASGCPHPKQTQVLMVYRDDSDAASAQKLLDDLGLARLAEDQHVVVVFPNPQAGGWNYTQDQAREDDADFVVRCFAALPRSRGGVAGFNGMMLHLATTPGSSALVMTLASTRPLDAAAVVVGALPEGFDIPAGTGAPVDAWLYQADERVSSFFTRVDGPCRSLVGPAGICCHSNEDNQAVCWCASTPGLTAETVRDAWRVVLSEARRWRNDTFGTYQRRTHFGDLGFVAHVDDASLGLADELPRTWFEYVPEAVAQDPAPAPLVIYLHGINCCGTYGAEQSGWDAIARRDGLMAVFPTATIENRWNVWDDPRLPSDVDYVMALIEHMDAVHPVDRSRIYISGFSMGSMFTNTLAAAYPDVFAGAVALNGPAEGLLRTLDESRPGILALQPRSCLADIGPSDALTSPVRDLAEHKRAVGYRMPLVQFVGLLDSVGMGDLHAWPVRGEDDGLWPATVRLWQETDGLVAPVLLDSATPTGLASGGLSHEGRFWTQTWQGAKGGAGLYRLVSAERMPHAVDLAEVELGWEFVRHFRRRPDGTLSRD